jgi:hypothetical protein
MILIWKNKGLHILFYVFFSFLGTITVAYFIEKQIGGELSDINNRTLFAFTFLISGLWTYLTKYDYYKDKQGNKVKLDMDNSLYWIKMKYWPYILWGIGFLIFIIPKIIS